MIVQEIVLQLLMEKECMCFLQLITELVSANIKDQLATDQSASYITGYNVTVTTCSNGTTSNYFTSDSHYVLRLSDITDSPCNEISLTMSGYNGLDGEANIVSRIYLTSGIIIILYV